MARKNSPTTIVGSFPQPDWLIDREKLAGRFPPRVRAKELWRIPEPYLQQAWEDATLLAIRAQEDAGLDIVTDGEFSKPGFFTYIRERLDGFEVSDQGVALRHPLCAHRQRQRHGGQEPLGHQRHRDPDGEQQAVAGR